LAVLPVISTRNRRGFLLIVAFVGVVSSCGRAARSAHEGPSRAAPVELLTQDWSCAPLPELPTGAEPYAELRVLVDDAGRVAHVHIAKATTPEVGDLAARCAVKQRYAARRDAAGRPIAAVIEVSVRFGSPRASSAR
jgi:hypothetical protein